MSAWLRTEELQVRALAGHSDDEKPRSAHDGVAPRTEAGFRSNFGTVPELGPKPSTADEFWHSVSVISFAWRLSFCNASLFSCNFICEYFLNI